MNRDQALTATLDELRDARAEMDGWIRLERSNDIFEHKNTGEIHASDGEVADHPYPPTLDGAAKALPEGWSFEVASGTWLKDDGKTVDRVGFYAWAGRKPSDPSDTHTETIFVEYATDEVTARYRLAVLCCLAEKEASK